MNVVALVFQTSFGSLSSLDETDFKSVLRYFFLFYDIDNVLFRRSGVQLVSNVNNEQYVDAENLNITLDFICFHQKTCYKTSQFSDNMRTYGVRGRKHFTHIPCHIKTSSIKFPFNSQIEFQRTVP